MVLRQNKKAVIVIKKVDRLSEREGNCERIGATAVKRNEKREVGCSHTTKKTKVKKDKISKGF